MAPRFSSEGDSRSEVYETGLRKSGFDSSNFSSTVVEPGSETMDSRSYVGAGFSPKTATTESLIARAAEDRFTAADAPELLESRLSESVQAAAAVGDTRLIPARPITPFPAANSLQLEGGGDLRLPTAAHQDLVKSNVKLFFELLLFMTRKCKLVSTLRDFFERRFI